MKVRYQFRIYPTNEQKQTFARVFGACRFVYNWALKLRKDSYNIGIKIHFKETCSALTTLKKTQGFEWLYETAAVPQQQSLRHLQSAYNNFFQKRAKYPKFKKKKGCQSATYTRGAFTWCSTTNSLVVSGVGKLKIRWSRQFESIPSTVTITKDTAGRYFASLVLDETKKPWPKTGKNIGIDLGITHLATLSTGEKIPNPRHLRRIEKRLKRAQKVLSRRKRESNRREKQRLKVAKLHAKVADCRKDYLQKITTDLVQRFDKIAIEDLNVSGMLKNHKLAKAIADVGFGEFRRMLEYKCDWYGKKLLFCDRFFPSSKMCSDCGTIKNCLTLDIRVWVCPECVSYHDRDQNAAINILAAGQAAAARGEMVRRRRGSSRRCTSRRNVNHLDGKT